MNTAATILVHNTQIGTPQTRQLRDITTSASGLTNLACNSEVKCCPIQMIPLRFFPAQGLDVCEVSSFERATLSEKVAPAFKPKKSNHSKVQAKQIIPRTPPLHQVLDFPILNFFKIPTCLHILYSLSEFIISHCAPVRQCRSHLTFQLRYSENNPAFHNPHNLRL